MNFFGLARRSVFRKPVKSILLLLIVFAISTLLLAGVASKNASIEVQDKTRQAIGAGFLLERNAEYRTKRLRECSEKIGNDKEGSFGGYHQEKEIINGVETWSGWTTNEFESLDIKDIEKLAKTKGIADYNITTATTPVNPVNFQRIEDKDVDQSVDVGGVSLIGNKDMKLDRNVLSGNLHIKEGRMITPEDKDMCVISEELAKQNNLKIGDKISFNDYHDTENSKVSEAEIVGIYQVDQKMSPLMQGDTYRSENVIFTDLRFPEKAEGETSPLYERAYFKVEDVEAYDKVKEHLQKVDINWEQYDLIDNNGNSETMSSNFNDLAKVSEMMILVISVASFVILVFVFLFWLKNRVQEVGIFLSLGVPKFRIIGQIWSEAIMIAVLSLMLSFAVAPAVSKVTANYLVSQQVQQMQEEEKNNEGKVSTEYVAPKQDVQSISVAVTPEMYLLDGVSVLVLITASVLVSGIVILKRNPKDILSEMS
ncbi:MAG: ABC transporter permease [Ruminococcus sp.]